MLAPGQKAATVSELVAHIKLTLEDTFNEVMVEGEISGISHAHSGHCYFNIMDEEASISCALFRQDLLRHPGFKNIKEGDRVLIYGPLTVYQKRGSFQIMVKRVMPAGEGLWKLKFEQLKKKLQSEGLFDPDKKKALPTFPKRVAIITAPGGAALHDFINVYSRRALSYELVISSALVQGDKAPQSLIKALDKVERAGRFDVVVFTRGGGSPEDLWCFNDEQLIRRMAKSSIPIISAVGHEVDWTLSDFVADLRCETPTAAAEVLTQPQTEVKRRLIQSKQRLSSHLRHLQTTLQGQLSRYHPKQLIGIVLSRLQEQTRRLEMLNPLNKIHQYLPVAQRSLELDDSFRRLESIMKENLQSLRERINQSQAKIDSLDPRAVLSRGYGIVESDQGIISSAKRWRDVPTNSIIKLVFQDGEGLAQKIDKDKK
ncbi:MAG: exodeoxyribonuclease VII large subunit [Bacteriovoracaceae bacterium]|nr:exodeoxyribonuclease VII large subunit [Bacteriovoracaceae bacterium]